MRQFYVAHQLGAALHEGGDDVGVAIYERLICYRWE
jgi:hypothetical protein